MGTDQKHGHGTVISIVDGGNTLVLEELSVTPNGFAKDDPVEQTSNQNTMYRSMCPAPLKTKPDTTVVAYYRKDTDLAIIKTLIESNNIATVTITTSDGSTIVDKGWLQSFEPDAQSGDARPQATFTVGWEGEDSSKTDNWAYTTST